MKQIILLTLLSALFACGDMPTIDEPLPEGYSEIKCVYMKGKGRYGTFTQYIKGAADYVKVIFYGTLPKDTQIKCNKDGISININADEEDE